MIFSKGSLEQHVVELVTVFERVAQAGLSLKCKKCTFATREIQYLGHRLSHEGIQPIKRLVQAFHDFPKPKDAVNIKRFVHLVGYYRKFIPLFAERAAALTKLTRKAAPWIWTENEESSFKDLQQVLTGYPLLAYPNFKLDFTLITDASRAGLGAVLMQDQGKGLQSIAFASQVNSRAVSNYGITDLECGAVVWAIKLFRPFLYGRKFHVITDHVALRWLKTSRNLTGRLNRWAISLQEYDFYQRTSLAERMSLLMR